MNDVTGMVSALLVGGPHDGQRVIIGMYENEIHMQRIQQQVSFDSYISQVDKYHKTNFHLQDKGKLGEFSLFTHSSIPTNSIVALQMLIDGYRNPRAPETSFSYDVESLEDYPPRRLHSNH